MNVSYRLLNISMYNIVMKNNKDTPIIVSACLAGLVTNYLGGSFPNERVIELVREGKTIPVCPEQLGGLPTPRPPAERIGDRVMTDEGIDVTAQFARGAEVVSSLVALTGARVAILKAYSPSCGAGLTYDGTFSEGLIEGDGVTAEKLREMGVQLFSDENLPDDFLR